MTDTLPADHRLGANRPPLDDAEALAKRLEREGRDLLNRAANLESDCAALPDAVEIEAQAAKVTDAAAKVKILIRDIAAFHSTEKAPYLEAGRVVDKFKTDVTEPLTAVGQSLVDRLNAYQRALRDRADAERRQREAEERERQRLAQEAEVKARMDAAAAEKRLLAAQATMRAAKTPSEMDAAERAIREAGGDAEAARAQATVEATKAAEAARLAETAAKTMDSHASRVTASGASAGGTRYWNHRISDPDALLKSLGPWAPYFSNDAVSTAIGAAKRELGPAARGALAKIALPGVTFFIDFRTNIQTARK